MLAFRIGWLTALAARSFLDNLKKGNPPSPPPTRKEMRHRHSMTQLLIGSMEILFLKLAATIFGLD